MNAQSRAVYRRAELAEVPSQREALLSAAIERQQQVIRQQADRIDLLEHALAPPGRRARARLWRSPWYVRIGRALGLVG